MDRNDGEVSRSYALGKADDSYEWYLGAAKKSRRYHRWTAVAIQLIAAAIPVSAAISPHSSIAPAVLGAAIVVLGGLRSAFDWHENYVRFSEAREAIEAERRRYHTASAPYDDPASRDQVLVAAVTRIEHEEMKMWFKIAEDKPDSSPHSRHSGPA